VEGHTRGEDLVATRIKQLPENAAFARINFLGTIEDILPEERTIIVRLERDVDVLVRVAGDTEIRGDLVVGALVKVSGVLGSDLMVTAYRVQVVSLLRCSPEALHLGSGESAQVDVVLREPLPEDVTLTIVSSNILAAVPEVDTLTIPAGRLTASFSVTAGSLEGRSLIDITLPETYGGGSCYVKVEVEEEVVGPEELQVRWSPRVIKAAPHESRQVALHLSYPAPRELVVTITRTEGPEGLVRFPVEVVFAAGRQVVHFMIELPAAGEGKLEVRLPGDLGGDADTLEIDVKHPPKVRLGIDWRPKNVTLPPGGTATVSFRLDRPAPEDLQAMLSLVEGDPAVVTGSPSLAGLPMTLSFPAGSVEQTFSFTAGDREGRLRLRAALPELSEAITPNLPSR